MTFAERLAALMPLIYPKFTTRTDSFGSELVFLRREESPESARPFSALDRTAYEAKTNAVRLFERLPERDVPSALRFAKATAENLLAKLKEVYPEKHFIVTLEFNPKSFTLLRFHQIWPGEELFVTPDGSSKNTEVLVFRA